MRFLSLLLMCFWSFASTAQTGSDIYRLFPVLECPAIGDEFEKMLSKLESIKVSIKENANCENIALQVKSLEDLVVNDREEVVAIIRRKQAEGQTPVAEGQPSQQVPGQGQGPSLNDQEAETIRAYAENVTKKVAALNDLFLRNNQCFQDDNADQQLTTLAGFVSEASQLVGSLSGPWGVPIALAGNVVAGFMTGLDQVLKSRAGFDYSKKEQWSSYVQNLCTYHSYRDQIDHLLNPQARISELNELKTDLDQQITLMTKSCAECRSIEEVFKSRTDLSSDLMKVMVNPQVVSADHRLAKPFGTYTLHSLGLRDWVVREIDRIQEESQSYWSDVAGRHILYRAKEEIEAFLLHREAPRFLDHQNFASERDHSAFIRFLAGDGRSLYEQLEDANGQVIQLKFGRRDLWNPLNIFRALVINPLNFAPLPEESDDLKYSWAHFRDQSLMKFGAAQTTTQVVQSFCSFFKHSGHYSPAIRNQCTSEVLKRLTFEQSQLAGELTTAKINSGLRPMSLPELERIPYSQNKLEALRKAVSSW